MKYETCGVPITFFCKIKNMYTFITEDMNLKKQKALIKTLLMMN